MPDPSKLKVGDRIRFVSIPDEWSNPEYHVHKETREFMEAMVKRSSSSRICKIDEHGRPCINARIKDEKCILHHYWGIVEHTGWRKVERKMN